MQGGGMIGGRKAGKKSAGQTATRGNGGTWWFEELDRGSGVGGRDNRVVRSQEGEEPARLGVT